MLSLEQPEGNALFEPNDFVVFVITLSTSASVMLATSGCVRLETNRLGATDIAPAAINNMKL